MKITCQFCNKEQDINIGKIIGSIKSEKKAIASRLNGLKHKSKKEFIMNYSEGVKLGEKLKNESLIYNCNKKGGENV